MEAKCKVINSNLYSSPHNKCMINPSREREDPFLIAQEIKIKGMKNEIFGFSSIR
jgi:hypothetical protein